MPDTPPCPMRTQRHPHAAHEWDGGESRCLGYGEPVVEGLADDEENRPAGERAGQPEFDVELHIPPSRPCRLHDLGTPHVAHDNLGGVCHGVLNRGPLGLTSSAPDGKTVDDPANVARLAVAEWEANAYRNQVTALIREMQRMSEEGGYERPVDVIVMDGRPVADEVAVKQEAENFQGRAAAMEVRIRELRAGLCDALGLDNDEAIDALGAARDMAQELDRAREAIRSVVHLHRSVGHRGEAICAHCSAWDERAPDAGTDNAPAPYPCDTVKRIWEANGEAGAPTPEDPS